MLASRQRLLVAAPIHIKPYIYTHTHTHTYICMYVCMYVYKYIHTYVYDMAAFGVRSLILHVCQVVRRVAPS
jgi:hypothetical protein